MSALAVPLVGLTLLVLAVVAFIVRRVVLARSVGSFDCSVRTTRGWVVGVARYQVDRLDWFRIFSLSPRPARVFERQRLALVGSRAPSGPEAVAVLPGVRIVACRYDATNLDLALSADAHTGLSSWLEASPPGQISHVT